MGATTTAQPFSSDQREATNDEAAGHKGDNGDGDGGSAATAAAERFCAKVRLCRAARSEGVAPRRRRAGGGLQRVSRAAHEIEAQLSGDRRRYGACLSGSLEWKAVPEDAETPVVAYMLIGICVTKLEGFS